MMSQRVEKTWIRTGGYRRFRGVWVNSPSVCDVGTMCSNMNFTNQVNAKISTVLDNFNYCKNYVKLEMDAGYCNRDNGAFWNGDLRGSC